MLKSEAVSYEILGEEYVDLAEKYRTLLDRDNGTPVGLFTGDECLSGLSPIQGTELCAVAEQMYSYEWLFAVTGDNKWAERLETLAFNALPATLSDDMWAHQYVQMSNQMACEKFGGRSLFRSNNDEAHLFGLEPNYGCCTANFNQAWPKFALSAFLHRDNTVLSAVPVPSVLSDNGITVVLETKYPFENALCYRVKTERAFTLQIRVPSFAENVTVNGKSANEKTLSFAFAAGSEAEITVCFDVTPHFIDRPYELKTAVCGSLVFSLPVRYEKVKKEYEAWGVERKFPYCDYEYKPLSPWEYAFAADELTVCRQEIGEYPFSSEHPPVVLQTMLKPIAWGLEDGFDSVCAKTPQSREPLGEAEDLLLYPYGCAKLRMTELPKI